MRMKIKVVVIYVAAALFSLVAVSSDNDEHHDHKQHHDGSSCGHGLHLFQNPEQRRRRSTSIKSSTLSSATSTVRRGVYAGQDEAPLLMESVFPFGAILSPLHTNNDDAVIIHKKDHSARLHHDDAPVVDAASRDIFSPKSTSLNDVVGDGSASSTFEEWLSSSHHSPIPDDGTVFAPIRITLNTTLAENPFADVEAGVGIQTCTALDATVTVGPNVNAQTCEAMAGITEDCTFTCTPSTTVWTLSKYQRYLRLMRDHVVPFYSKLLQVSAMHQASRMSIPECEPFATGDKTEYENTDVVVYMTMRSVPYITGLIGFARPCILHPSTNRPISMIVNIPPETLEPGFRSDAKVLQTIVHEMLHGFGFTPELYLSYRHPGNRSASYVSYNATMYPTGALWAMDAGGDSSTGGQSILAMGIDATGQMAGPTVHTSNLAPGTKLTVITPHLTAYAKWYYNCSMPAFGGGVELENHGASGSAGSHWEARILPNEIMASREAANSSLSGFTLQFLKDMGFYWINATMVANPQNAAFWDPTTEPQTGTGTYVDRGNQDDLMAWISSPGYPGLGAAMTFGFQAGCGFINTLCNESSTTNPIWPFSRVNQSSGLVFCTDDAKGQGYSNMVTYGSPLPTPVQYFPGYPRQGGTEAFMDYCPFVSPASNGDCPGNTEVTTDYYGSVGGVPSARCFSATAFSQSYISTAVVRATCYETVCLSSHELAIKLGDTFYQCPFGDTTTSAYPPPSGIYPLGAASSLLQLALPPRKAAPPGAAPQGRMINTDAIHTWVSHTMYGNVTCPKHIHRMVCNPDLANNINSDQVFASRRGSAFMSPPAPVSGSYKSVIPGKNNFTWPEISSIFPIRGTTAGGYTLTATGSGLDSCTTLRVGGVVLSAVVGVSTSTSITWTMPGFNPTTNPTLGGASINSATGEGVVDVEVGCAGGALAVASRACASSPPCYIAALRSGFTFNNTMTTTTPTTTTTTATPTTTTTAAPSSSSPGSSNTTLPSTTTATTSTTATPTTAPTTTTPGATTTTTSSAVTTTTTPPNGGTPTPNKPAKCAPIPDLTAPIVASTAPLLHLRFPQDGSFRSYTDSTDYSVGPTPAPGATTTTTTTTPPTTTAPNTTVDPTAGQNNDNTNYENVPTYADKKDIILIEKQYVKLEPAVLDASSGAILTPPTLRTTSTFWRYNAMTFMLDVLPQTNTTSGSFLSYSFSANPGQVFSISGVAPTQGPATYPAMGSIMVLPLNANDTSSPNFENGMRSNGDESTKSGAKPDYPPYVTAAVTLNSLAELGVYTETFEIWVLQSPEEKGFLLVNESDRFRKVGNTVVGSSPSNAATTTCPRFAETISYPDALILFRIVVESVEPPISLAAVETLSSIGSASAVASAFLSADPTFPLVAARAAGFFSTAACDYELSKTLPFGVMPIRMAYGPAGKLELHRGNIIAILLIEAVFMVAVFFVVAIVRCTLVVKYPPPEQNSMAVSPFMKAMQICRAPGIMYLPFIFFIQGAFMSSTTLVAATIIGQVFRDGEAVSTSSSFTDLLSRSSRDVPNYGIRPSYMGSSDANTSIYAQAASRAQSEGGGEDAIALDVALGAIGIVIHIAATILIIRALFYNFEAADIALEDAKLNAGDMEKKVRGRFFPVIAWANDPWDPAATSCNFVYRYTHLFSMYVPPFQKLLVLEVFISIFVGILDGIRVQQYCTVLSFVHLAFFAIQLITLFVTRPYGTLVSLAVMGLMSIGNAAAALFGGAASILESTQFSAEDAAEGEASATSPTYEKVRMGALILCAVVPILVLIKLILDIVTLLRCCSRGNYKDGIVNEGLQYSSSGGIITGGAGNPQSSANLTGPLLVVTTGGNGNKNPSSSVVVETPPMGTVFAGGATSTSQLEIGALPPPPPKKKVVVKTVTRTLRKTDKGDDQEMAPVVVDPVEPIAEGGDSALEEEHSTEVDLLGGQTSGDEGEGLDNDAEDDGDFTVDDDDI